MTVTENFRRSKENIIQSFNFTDIAEGTGIVRFSGYNHQEDTVDGYSLAQNTLYSQVIQSSSNSTSSAYVREMDLDFDVKFNLSKRVKGLAKVNFTFGAGDGSADNAGDNFMVVNLRHFDGTTEKHIASGATNVISNTPTAIVSQTANMEFDISTLQEFKKDETLRLNMEYFTKRTGANNHVIAFSHDPKERDPTTPMASSDPSELTIDIPFILDL